MVAVALAPLVIAAGRLLVSFRSRYDPVFDHAVIEFTVRAVGRHAVVVGMPSRFGWFHPGPLLFYVLAVPYRLLGSVSVGLYVGALAVNALSIIGIALVARRRGGLLLALWTLVIVGVLCHTLGPDFLRDPWPPFVSVLPFFLFIMLVWSTAVGDTWTLPWAVAVGTFLVQTHVGYAITVVALLLCATAALVIRTVRAGTSRAGRARLRTVGVVAGGLGILLWLPPLYDELFGSGNATHLFDYFTSGHDTAGLSTAWRAIELQLDTRPEWLFGARPPLFGGFAPVNDASPFVAVLILGGIAAVVSLMLRRVTDARQALTLAATLGVAIITSIVAVSGIVGPLFTYLVRWTWVVGAAIGLLIVWVALIGLQRLWPRTARIGAGVAAVAVVALSTVTSVDVAGVGVPQSAYQPLIRSAASQLLARLGSDHRAVVFTGTRGGLDEVDLALQLARHGIPVHTDRGAAARVLYIGRGGAPRIVRVVSGPEAATEAPSTGEVVLARASQPYSASERRNAQQNVARARQRGAPEFFIQALEAVARGDAKSAVAVFGRLE